MSKNMKKFVKGFFCVFLIIAAAGLPKIQVQAQEEDRILQGVYIEDMSLGGMTASEAKAMVENYVGGLCERTITLTTVNDNSVQITPADVGLHWNNPEIVEEAAKIGQTGNIVQRYKAAKDLQYQNTVFQLELAVDEELIKYILEEQCSVYNVEAADATLTRTEGSFTVNPGQTGQIVDVAASTTLITDYLCGGWNGQDAALELEITVDEPRGTEEELSKVKDVLGTFTTSFQTSGQSRSANVRNGCALINGATIYPGDEFSTYEAVSPFSQSNGYYMAGSYLNGQVVDSLGGGICQVSTTLYNAVLLSELEVTERHNHSMIVTYVSPSADAAIAESAGKDFKFINNTEAPIYIEGVTTDNKQITFTIYGMETRDSSRQVRYESEVVSQTYPDTEVIYPNASLPVGSVSVQSAHIGYKANLWKIVTENGSEVSREQVNSSAYKMVPRTATVGTATEDPNIYNQIMEAIATNSIDHVKNVALALSGAAVPPAEGETPAEGVPAEAAPAANPPAEAGAEG
ncbi:MAG: VanW family protein [Clostridium sp.]|nr:VanW family protein [Clostridium sp.]